MKSHSTLTILVFLFTLPSVTSADALSQFLKAKHSETGFSGSVLVAQGEQSIYAGGFGFANETWSIPADTETRYIIASITKTMTAALVLALADEDKLSLTATIDTYLPDYPAEYSNNVTLLQLLRHTSGIPNFNALDGWFDGAFLRESDPNEFLNVVAAMPLVNPPGTGYQYSNANYLLLSEIVAAVTGKTFVASLDEKLFGPLKMNNTGVVRSNTEVVTALAQNYRPTPDGVYKGGGVNIAHFIGSASNYSTVHDLYKFVKGIWSNAVLSEKSRKLMLDSVAPIGWNVADIVLEEGASPNRVVWYSGELEGYNSIVTHVSGHDLYVVVLNNNNQGYEEMLGLTQELIQLLRKQ